MDSLQTEAKFTSTNYIQDRGKIPGGKEKPMIKIRVIKKIIRNEERFQLEYVYYLGDGKTKVVPVRAEPRGWKTLKGALRFAEKLGYEIENPEEYK